MVQCRGPAVVELVAGEVDARGPPGILPLGWRWSFVIGAAIALCALAATPRGSRPARPPLPAARSATPLALAVIGAAASLAAAAANAMTIFLVASSVSRGIAPATAGLVLTLGSVIALFMRMLHGWLADRRPTGHFAYVAGSLTLGAIGVALLALPGTVPLLVGVVLGMGLGWSWPGLLQFAIVRLNPSSPATATGAVQVGVYAGGCLGPLCFGFIANALRLRNRVDPGSGRDGDSGLRVDDRPTHAALGLTAHAR
ncbi:MFS transporter [Rhodococcus sp. NPDC059968]|uniref:MFS transporter n=1 Tax=Rhodococcus sp. NPDC059968 TaxID=3347017 RepID=UPI00366A9608